MKPPIFLSASEPDPRRAPEYWNSRRLLNVREAVRAFCAHTLPHFPVVFGGHPAITPLVRNVAERAAIDARADENEEEEEVRPHAGESLPCVLMYQSAQFVAPDSRDDDRDPGEEEELVREILLPAHDQDGTEKQPKSGSRSASLLYMRYQMIGRPIDAALRAALRPQDRDHWLLRRYGARLGAERHDLFDTYAFSAAVFIGGMEGVEREYHIFRSFHPQTPAFPIGSTGSACERLLPRVAEHLPLRHVEALQHETAYSLLMQQLLPVGGDVAREVGWSAKPEPPQFSLADHTDPENLRPKSS